MNSRHTLALSAALAATVLTGGAAILGIVATPHPVVGTAPVSAVAQAPAAAPAADGEVD